MQILDFIKKLGISKQFPKDESQDEKGYVYLFTIKVNNHGIVTVHGESRFLILRSSLSTSLHSINCVLFQCLESPDIFNDPI